LQEAKEFLCRDRSGAAFNHLWSKVSARPGRSGQFAPNGLRRGGENQSLCKSESLRDAQEPLEQGNAAQFNQGFGGIRQDDQLKAEAMHRWRR
jgi:hypothetical protein